MPYLGSSNQIQLKSPNGIMGKNLHLIRSAPSNSTTVQHTIKMEQEKIRYLSNSQYVLTYTPSHSCPFFFTSGCLYIMWFSRHSCHNFCHNVSAQRATIVRHGAGWGLRRGSDRCLHRIQFDAIHR